MHFLLLLDCQTLFRRLFAEGTFNAAFVPSYTSEKLESKKKGQIFANNVFNLLLLILVIIVTIVEIFTPFFVYLIAPGFIENKIKFDLAVEFTRITFPFLLFVSFIFLFFWNSKFK